MPKLAEINGGLYLDAPEEAAQMNAYKGFFSAAWDSAKARLMLKCMLGGCTAAPISYDVVGATDVKATFPMKPDKVEGLTHSARGTHQSAPLSRRSSTLRSSMRHRRRRRRIEDRDQRTEQGVRGARG